ncbi:MAG: hypothetical protein PHG47_08985 [Sulfuricella sp.]|nr:hypothetical protein [Sulfuricella sp.]
MEWEFSAEDVVQGNADYGLADFRRDLAQETRLNLPQGADQVESEKLFELVYDLCYWLATGRDLVDFEREVGADPYLAAFLRMVHRHSGPNVAMLGAILQRAIMDGVEAGMPLEAALEAAAARHAQVVGDAVMVLN